MLGMQAEGAPRRRTHPRNLADERHDVGRCDRLCEVELALRNGVNEVLGADQRCARGARLLRLVAARKDGDADGLARPKGQLRDAADVLRRLARVDAELHLHLDRLVEIGTRRSSRDAHGLLRVERGPVPNLRV